MHCGPDILLCCLLACAVACVYLQLFPSIMHQIDGSLPKGDIDAKIIDFGTAQLCKDGCSVAEGISGTPGRLLPWLLCVSACPPLLSVALR
jgi:hypothetical protein